MRIAVTSQNLRTITGHAGKTRRFIVFEAEPGREPVEVDRLYEGERAMLAVMAGRPAVWNKNLAACLKDVGLPGDRVMLGRVLGVVSPGVISRHLDPAGVGKTFSSLLSEIAPPVREAKKAE